MTRPRRRKHPASVTVERLNAVYGSWWHLLDREERIALGVLRAGLAEIAAGARDKAP